MLVFIIVSSHYISKVYFAERRNRKRGQVTEEGKSAKGNKGKLRGKVGN